MSYQSTTARGQLWLATESHRGPWWVAVDHPGIAAEFGPTQIAASPGLAAYRCPDKGSLYTALDRTYRLGVSLPDMPLATFQQATSGLPLTTEAERTVVQPGSSPRARHHTGHPTPRKLQAARTLFSKAPLQAPGAHRTDNRQAEALQARRHALREDRHQLFSHHQFCVRADAGEIRPHGLAPLFPDLDDEEYLKSLGQLQPRYDLAIPSLDLIIEVKFIREGKSFSKVIGEIAEDVTLYLRSDTPWRHLIPVVWDNSSRTEEHYEFLSGLRRLDGVADAVVISRPARMMRQTGSRSISGSAK